ncbi:OsmC family protein [Algoriphagus sp. SE2]|uniref:OsmC family protein n=1 Tax=Algoriphagus sp. SE2 TaxID=3141536 RepID=UPI0031CD9F5F
MIYSCKASSTSKEKATISIKKSEIEFGISADKGDLLSSPAELFLGSISACILKNVERLSSIMNFEYKKAEIEVKGTRLEKPPRMDEIKYELLIYTKSPTINVHLLQMNIEKFGTIVNTVKKSCLIQGEVKIIET